MKINSVDKAITILNCFSVEKPVRGVGEIGQITGITPSTVSRLLSTLESRGVVEKLKGMENINWVIEFIYGVLSVKKGIILLPSQNLSWKSYEMNAAKKFHSISCRIRKEFVSNAFQANMRSQWLVL